MIQIPIYRAKKIDGDEYVEGYYSYSPDTKHGHDECNKLIHFINSYRWTWVGWKHVHSIIDISTLAISFNNGKTWYSDFESIDDICREYLPDLKVTGIQL